MSKVTLIILLTIIVILAVILSLIIIFPEERDVQNDNLENLNLNLNDTENQNDSKEISVVSTMQDTISSNSAWCGTFQLVWNDMQNNLVGGNVTFEEPNVMVDNLNKQSFKEENISSNYYYKNWGLMNTDLKSEIEKGIKKKFNETSDILDLFNWPDKSDEDKDKYFFYAMLKRNFEFEKEFTVLENGKFEKTENIQYFGINEETKEPVRNQVEVLYYNNDTDFAVMLYTKENDQVILARNPNGDNFEQIYKNVNNKADLFEGSTTFGKEDILSIPNLNIDVLKEYKELENKLFSLKNGEPAFIEQAVQTIKMQLDNKGGSIKSEAGMAVMKNAISLQDEPRNFNFNGKFAIFLKESDKEIPYFAANIENINLFK